MYRKPFSEPLHDVYMPFVFSSKQCCMRHLYFAKDKILTNVTSASESD